VTPKRIQRKRTTGWRKPENTVCVSRPSIFGNPFIVGRPSGYQFNDGGDETPMIPIVSLAQSIELFESLTRGMVSPEMYPWGHRWMERFNKMGQHPSEAIRTALRGKNLACWCPLDRPCHADILLKVANSSPPSSMEYQKPHTPQVPDGG
jgi:hypothetical protein